MAGAARIVSGGFVDNWLGSPEDFTDKHKHSLLNDLVYKVKAVIRDFEPPAGFISLVAGNVREVNDHIFTFSDQVFPGFTVVSDIVETINDLAYFLNGGLRTDLLKDRICAIWSHVSFAIANCAGNIQLLISFDLISIDKFCAVAASIGQCSISVSELAGSWEWVAAFKDSAPVNFLINNPLSAIGIIFTVSGFFLAAIDAHSRWDKYNLKLEQLEKGEWKPKKPKDANDFIKKVYKENEEIFQETFKNLSEWQKGNAVKTLEAKYYADKKIRTEGKRDQAVLDFKVHAFKTSLKTAFLVCGVTNPLFLMFLAGGSVWYGVQQYRHSCDLKSHLKPLSA